MTHEELVAIVEAQTEAIVALQQQVIALLTMHGERGASQTAFMETATKNAELVAKILDNLTDQPAEPVDDADWWKNGGNPHA